KVLVDNRASNVVAIDRSRFATKLGIGSWSVEGWNALPAAKRNAALQPLSTVLGVPVDVLAKRLVDQRTSPYTPMPVATDVGEDKLVRLLKHSDAFHAMIAD